MVIATSSKRFAAQIMTTSLSAFLRRSGSPPVWRRPVAPVSAKSPATRRISSNDRMSFEGSHMARLSPSTEYLRHLNGPLGRLSERERKDSHLEPRRYPISTFASESKPSATNRQESRAFSYSGYSPACNSNVTIQVSRPNEVANSTPPP